MILSSQDMAFIANRLQVPLIMDDILNDKASLSAEVEYGLHEILSDFQPDSALLAMALSAKILINASEQTSPNLNVLEMECNRIIQDYGPIWARNAQNKSVDIDQIYDVLVHTTDDLESLARLLETNISSFEEKNETAGQLCRILQVQAKAQAMVADAFMTAAEEKAQEIISPELSEPAFTAASLSDNIIPFPASNVH